MEDFDQVQSYFDSFEPKARAYFQADKSNRS